MPLLSRSPQHNPAPPPSFLCFALFASSPTSTPSTLRYEQKAMRKLDIESSYDRIGMKRVPTGSSGGKS